MSGTPPTLTLRVLPGDLAICRLEPDEPLPAWVFHDEARFFSITRTPRETSVVCAEDDVPPSVARAERGWRALEVQGPPPFDLTGVLSGITAPLAAGGIPVFAISTYDTDYLLVRSEHLERAVAVLRPLFAMKDGDPA